MKGPLCYLLVFFLAGLFFPACDRTHQPSQEILDRADSYMTNHPDSALFVLENTLSTAVLSPRQQADHAILLTQARDKNYITHTSDSLIRIAVDYYESKRNPERLMTAYYYTGRVSQDMGDALKAQEYYKKALETGKNSTDYYLLALINNYIGFLYMQQRLANDALPYLEQSAAYMERAGHASGHSYVLQNIARVHRLLKNREQSITHYKKALAMADDTSRPDILLELGDLYTEMKDHTSAYNYLQEAFRSAQDPDDYYPACLSLGDFFINTGKADSALYYLRESVKSPRLTTRAASYLSLMDLSKQKQDWKEYAGLHTHYGALQDSIVQQMHTNNLLQAENMYNYQLVQKEAELAHAKNTVLEKNIAISLLLLCMVLAASLLYARSVYKRKKEWEIQYRKLINKHQEKTILAEQNNKRIAELEQIISRSAPGIREEALLEKKVLEFSNLQIEETQLFKKQLDERFKYTEIYTLFHTTTRWGDRTPEDINQLVEQIDLIYPNFKSKISEVLPQINSKDLLLCYFLKAEIGPTDIGKILSQEMKTISKRKSRLLEKMRSSGSDIEDLQSFINSLF